MIRVVIEGKKGFVLNHRGNGKVQIVSRDSRVAKGDLVEATLIKEGETFQVFKCLVTQKPMLQTSWIDGCVGYRIFVDGKWVGEGYGEVEKGDNFKLLDQCSWWGGRSNNSLYFYEIPKNLAEEMIIRSQVAKVLQDLRVNESLYETSFDPKEATTPLRAYMWNFRFRLEDQGIKNLCEQIKKMSQEKEINSQIVVEAAKQLLAAQV